MQEVRGYNSYKFEFGGASSSYVPDALAVLKERNQPVFADLQDAAESRGRDGGSCTASFNVFRMQVCHVRVTEYGAECQQVRIPVQHDSDIDASYGFQN